MIRRRQQSASHNQLISTLRVTLFSLVGLALLLLPNQADSAVELQFFRGSYDEEAESVVLEWTTSYESRTAYYFIKRKESGTQDTAETINVVLQGSIVDRVDAAVDGATGASYQVFDLEVDEDTTYEYSLWEMETNNVEPANPERSIVIQAAPQQTSTELGEATPTSTATVTPTSDPNNTSTPTPETQPTATVPATSTPVTDSDAATTATPSAEATSESDSESTAAQATTATQESESAAETATPLPTPSPTATETLEESAPAPSPTPLPTLTPTAQAGVAEASELQQEETYPEPEGTTTGEEAGEYVPPLTTNTPEPISQQNTQPIGSNNSSSEQPVLGGQAVEQIDEAEINQNRFILWGGFIGSLLFFIAVMVGTILMYRQRNNGG
ncbi:MAG: hypothetical protein AAF902_24145 [Chloroflexota bacterium]